MLYILTYDLNAVADYQPLYDFLDEMDSFSVSDSTWLICSDEDAETLYEQIEDVFYDDTLVLFPLGEGVIGGTDEEIDEFIEECRNPSEDDNDEDEDED
jgi:hypothetical protein